MVCHYGQHSFGHYICYRRIPRRGPKGEWVPPTLVDPLRIEDEEIDKGMDGDNETETDADGTIKVKRGSKQNGNAKGRASAASLGSSGTGTRYYWEDRTEMEVGTNRGWLRISDDSVEECGIERVLAETSGVFMLYYERAVPPKVGLYSYAHRIGGSQRGERNGKSPRGDFGNSSRDRSKSRSRSSTRTNGTATEVESEGVELDTDADGFSIDSEETLKPQLKVVNLNGSVGSLVSEVGVGVLKKDKSKAKDKEKEKERERERKERDHKNDRMTTSLYLPGSSTPSSKGVGAHIIRNVTAGRPKILSKSYANGNEKEYDHHLHSSSRSDLNSPRSFLDGSSIRADDAGNVDVSNKRIPQHMIASAPSILHQTSSSSSSALPNSRATLGSRSTMFVHHPPLSSSGVQVKDR